MKFLRKPIACLCILALLAGCSANAASVQQPSPSQKLQIVATLFPQYDFARQLAGETADITLLLPPGGESHSFEPSPSDIIRISQADVFLYTGDAMETWVPNILAGIENPDLLVVDVSQGISLEPEDDHHDHGSFDPHIWTSPVKAMKIVENIGEALCQADPAQKTLYEENQRQYLDRLAQLDTRFREITAAGSRKDFIFGSRFACRYFAAEYALEPDSPYDSCSSETEPGAQAMARVIDHIKAKGIPVIYYQELSDQRVAMSVAEATGAAPLLFHSCHNVSREDFENGVTYLSLMEQNAVNLEMGLA